MLSCVVREGLGVRKQNGLLHPVLHVDWRAQRADEMTQMQRASRSIACRMIGFGEHRCFPGDSESAEPTACS